MGKSSMIHSIQSVARSYGYFASAKFDQARKTPFEPVLRLLSSLFRQIFSEADVSTDFHNHIRTHVQSVWGVLHSYLDLPEWLLNPAPNGNIIVQVPVKSTEDPNADGKLITKSAAGTKAGDVAADWLRAVRTGGSTKSSRFTNIFLGVLRVVAVQKFIAFAVDDLQFADPESLELLEGMVKGKVPLVLILTRRDEDPLPKKAHSLVNKSTKIV